MHKTQKFIPLFSLITLIGSLFVLTQVVPKLLKPKIAEAQTEIFMEEGCDLALGSCFAVDRSLNSNSSKEIKVNLDIQAPALVSMTPLDIYTRIEGVPADRVTLSLDGKDMYMGFNTIEMSQVNNEDNTWQVTTELSFCTTDKMVWRAKITTYNEGIETLVAHFDFVAD